jgi:hypothetical protein
MRHARSLMKKIPVLLLIALVMALPIHRRVISQPPPAEAIPAPWLGSDLDAGPRQGASRSIGSSFRLTSSGPNISGTKDACHFMHQRCVGNVVIVARIVSIAGPARSASGGLMIRAGLDPSALQTYVGLTASNGVAFIRRDQPGAICEMDLYPIFPAARVQKTVPAAARLWSEVDTNGASRLSAPCWLKLIRRGPDLAAWCSANGTNWDWIGTERIHLPGAIEIGLAVTGGDADRPCAVLFDQVQVQPIDATNAVVTLGNGIGLLGTLRDAENTNGIQRINATINFGWGRRPPAPGISNQFFSGLWEGFVEPVFSGPCAFSIAHDDDVRLWIDGQLLIEDVGKTRLREAKAMLSLNAGVKYPLRLEYHQGLGPAVLKLRWSGPMWPTQIIPRSQLHPPNGYDRLQSGAPAQPFDLSEGLEALQAIDQRADLDAPWLSRSFRPGTNTGQAHSTDTGLSISASGSLTGRGVDDGRFVYRPWTGDVQIVARVRHLEDAPAEAKAGLMIRQTLAENECAAFLALTPRGPTRLSHRLKAGNQTQWVRPPRSTGPGSPADNPLIATQSWLKLVRRGDNFAAYSSSDGTGWTLLGVVSIPMEPEVFVGLALGSGAANILSQASFEFIEVSLPPPLAPLVGSGDGLAGIYFDASSSNSVFQVDPQINFFWARRPPAEGIPPDHFRARWEGLLEAQFSDLYSLYVINDGSIRVWFDGQLVLRGSNGPRERERVVQLALLAGHRYPIKIEYVPGAALAGARPARACRLLWSSPDTPKIPIPQTQLYSTANAAFAAVPDQDRDQMPDRWETRHELDPFDNADATADADKDGLTNLAEFQAGTNPRQPDSDGDGLPDGWELGHRLNPLLAADAQFDRDRDQLNNRAEFAAGTSPDASDSDGDGLSDFDEIEMRSNPLAADTTGVQTVADLSGAAAVAQLGRWEIQRQSIVAVDGRGSVDFDVSVPAADVYQLEIEAGPSKAHDRHREFELLVSVDGEYIGRHLLVATNGRAGGPASGMTRLLTPWLRTGRHRVSVFWDNAVWNRTFQISALRAQTLQGIDANGNGVKDWAEKRLTATCGLEVAPRSSAVSPAGIEGRGRYLSLLRLSNGASPQRAPENRWYADIGLSASNSTTIICSFENDALRSTNRITWRPTNLLQTGPLTIRAGDALLLGAFPEGATNGTSEIRIEGVTNYLLAANATVPHQFWEPGTFQVVAAWSGVYAGSQSATVSVNVVTAALGPSAAAWVGKWRPWRCVLPAEAVIEADSSLVLEHDRSVSGVREYWLLANRPEAHSIVTRLGTNGPVLASLEVQGFNLYSGYETALRRIETRDDGAELVQMGLVLSPIPSELIVRIDLHVGGVLFEEGTLIKQLTRVNFDDLGRASVRFLRPPSSKTSVCHRTRALQGPFLLGIYP